jgi:hypothetical protein
MKKLTGFLLLIVFVAVSGAAFAAELNIGSRFYTKFLDRNTYDPAFYRTTGNGVGIRSELELTLDGRVSDRAEMGARILTVWAPPGITPDYSDWAGWYNGDANLWQVRGMWLRFYPATLPTVKSVLIGSTDLGMFNAWTIGKIRWIDRDNARIILGEGKLAAADYKLAAVPLPPSMGPGYSTGPNPRRGWVYGASLSGSPNQALNLKLIGSRVLAQEQDPDTTDDTQGVNRFDNSVGTLEFLFTPNPVLNIEGLVGLSNYSADPTLIGPPMVWWPHIPYDDVNGLALKFTATANDPLGIGLTVKGQYFDVSPDFVSIMAARRETNVLISEGYVRYGADVNGSTWDGNVGFTPSDHVDNGITDWNEPYYINIIGTTGFTVIPEFRRGPLGVKGEFSYTANKLNSQDVDTVKYFWSAPRVDQSGYLGAVRVDYLLPIGLDIFGKVKMVNNSDGVNTSIDTDNLAMNDTEIYGGVSFQLTDELGITGGYKNLNYVNKGNGLDEDVKTYELQAGMIFANVKYNVGGVDVGLAWEKVDGEDKIADADVDDMRFKGTVEIKI